MITFVFCVDGEFKMLFTVRYCLTFHTLLYVSIHSYSEPTGVNFTLGLIWSSTKIACAWFFFSLLKIKNGAKHVQYVDFCRWNKPNPKLIENVY